MGVIMQFKVTMPDGGFKVCAVGRVCDVPHEFWVSLADEIGLSGVTEAVGVAHDWAKCQFGAHEHQYVTNYDIRLSRAVETAPKCYDYTQNSILLKATATEDYSDSHM